MIASFLRPSIAGARSGDHLCCIYNSEEEHRAILTPFLRQGLEQGQKVVYIVDAHGARTILSYLCDAGLDTDRYVAGGRLVILTPDDAYLRGGVFDPQKMIALLEASTERALQAGYQGLRVTGEMTWALRKLPGSDRLIDYESRLNEFFPGHECLALCQYDLRRFDSPALLDVLSTHPVAVIGTEVYDNVYYAPPSEYSIRPSELLDRDRATAQLIRAFQHLAECKRRSAERGPTGAPVEPPLSMSRESKIAGVHQGRDEVSVDHLLLQIVELETALASPQWTRQIADAERLAEKLRAERRGLEGRLNSLRRALKQLVEED